MIRALRLVLYAIAAAASLLGLWGILANLALPLMPDYGKTQWNFSGVFEPWKDTGNPEEHNDTGISREHSRDLRIPWWAISFQTPCLYLDPLLAGPVGDGFYTLCLGWGMGTIIMLRLSLRADAGRVFRPRILFAALWLIGLGGIVAHVLFFAWIVRQAPVL